METESNTIVVRKCISTSTKCANKYQDKIYKGKRIMNKGITALRCTVCGTKQ